MHSPVRRPLLIGAAVGLAIALFALDRGFIAGTGGMWVRPGNDFVLYVVAWNYYLADPWRWPLFDVPGMGYPEGGSVLVMDALPLTAALTKLLHSSTGVRINPFGWWVLLTYVLQGAMAARLVYAAGAPSAWAALAAATLAVCSAAFVGRLEWEHLALSSHFVILWALSLYFESLRGAKLKTLEWFGLAALTLLVNSYLFAMVMAIFGASAASLWTRRRPAARDVGEAALGVLWLAAIGLAAGYGFLFTNPAQMQATGFGVFSWNLAGLLVPPDGVFGLLGGIVRDATGGQYEGEAYVGHGALLFPIAALAAPRHALRAVREHAWLCALLALLLVYAASNRVYLGPKLLVSYDLPPLVAELCSFFRASGRFIWPLAYSLAVLPVAFGFRTLPRAAAIGLALLAVVLQLVGARPAFERVRTKTSAAHPDLLERGLVEWIGRHERLWLYPSWWCGSLGGPTRSWHGMEANWDLQVQLAASRAGVPINSVYTARQLKDCRAEADWSRRPAFEPGVGYVLGHAAAGEPALADLVRSHRCTRFRWATVCSTSEPPPAAR